MEELLNLCLRTNVRNLLFNFLITVFYLCCMIVKTNILKYLKELIFSKSFPQKNCLSMSHIVIGLSIRAFKRRISSQQVWYSRLNTTRWTLTYRFNMTTNYKKYPLNILVVPNIVITNLFNIYNNKCIHMFIDICDTHTHMYLCIN